MDDILDREFEFDFCVASNMLLGMTHEEAKKEAKKWIEDAE